MDHNFSKLIASTSNARMRIRLLAISYFTDGKNRTDIAKFLKVSRTSVNKWVTQYLNEGLDGLTEKPHSGRPALLSQSQCLQIKKYVTDNAVKSQGGRLQGKDIQRYIHSEFGVLYQKTNIYHLLHELNLSWITTRSKHPKQSVEAQEAFKKIPNRKDP
jgi:transposase